MQKRKGVLQPGVRRKGGLLTQSLVDSARSLPPWSRSLSSGMAAWLAGTTGKRSLSRVSQPQDTQRLQGFWPGGLEGAHVQGKEFFPPSVMGFQMLFTFTE